MGRTPHDAGSPVDDPWFVVSQYSATRPAEAPLRVDWLDLPAKFVQQAHAYWTYTGDDTFGAEVYPALARTMNASVVARRRRRRDPRRPGMVHDLRRHRHGRGGHLRGRTVHRGL